MIHKNDEIYKKIGLHYKLAESCASCQYYPDFATDIKTDFCRKAEIHIQTNMVCDAWIRKEGKLKL